MDQTSEKLRYAENEGLKICDATTNPTKDYQRPLGMVYSPGRERLEKPILHKQDEYCFKCHFNTGDAFLDNCHHCNTDSFIGCGYKIEWKDDENMPTGGSSFFCCYCGSLHRDIAYTYEVDSDKMMLASNIIAEWVSKQNKSVSSARRQYEAKVANNDRTVNKHSARLYGNDNDESTQLAVCIYNLHWNTKESKEHVCPECDRIYKDVIDLTTQYNPKCIDCAAVSFYNSRGLRMIKETSMMIIVIMKVFILIAKITLMVVFAYRRTKLGTQLWLKMTCGIFISVIIGLINIPRNAASYLKIPRNLLNRLTSRLTTFMITSIQPQYILKNKSRSIFIGCYHLDVR